ncbi:tyrosine-type recombinase/integrase [Haloarcula japonica]|uniref:tyrosine-type recombinase/integrase n=1 Tax=Haloarcula japonica TaxID=29282 RepID=UPI0039F6DA4D
MRWILDHVNHRLRSAVNTSSKSEEDDRTEPYAEERDRFAVPNALACAYLDRRAGTQLTEPTVESYESQLREFTTFLQNRSLSVVEAEFTDILDYVEWCVNRGNRQSTIEGKLTTIKELYKFVRLRTEYGDELSIDPIELETLDLKRFNTPAEIEREALTREELRRLFDAMDSYRNRLMATVAAETGLRNSDLRNLRLTDVDLDGPSLHVRDPKNAVPYDVPFSHDLAFELELWCNQYRAAYGGAQHGEFVFPGQSNARIETNEGLNQIVKTAAEKAGIQETLAVSELTPAQQAVLQTNREQREWHRVTVHTLRHTCLTLMKEADISLQYRQLVANHDPSTTQRYSHGQEEEFATIREQYDPPR